MKKTELEKIREEIDSIDNKIVQLIDNRFSSIKKISKIKRHLDLPITDIKRENQIVNRLCRKHQNLTSIIKNLYYVIFNYSKQYQLYKNKSHKIISELRKIPIIIAGPCSIESEKQIVKISDYLKKKKIKFIRGGVYKPQTHPDSFQGLELDGLNYFRKIANKNNQYIVFEILTVEQLNLLYDFIDIIQIGSRNMTSFVLLKAIGKKTSKDNKRSLLK